MRAKDAAALACAAIAAAGCGYAAIAIAAMRRSRAARAEPPEFTPPLTVIRPLHGDEPGLFERLCEICEQEYPVYQVLFAVRDPLDPAAAIARRVADRYPRRDVRVIAGEARDYANPKIGNVAGAYPHAKHDLIVIADSDISVEPAYLRRIAACFLDDGVGVVTALYGASPAVPGAAARLAALHVNDQFSPSVLVAQRLGPIDYCFGATMAVRRDVLQQIGGLETIGAYLADDYMLGKLAAESGYAVGLCTHPVATVCTERSLRELLAHEVRWARTIRAMQPAGFAGSVLTYPAIFGAASAALAPRPATLAMAAAAFAMRALLHEEARATFAPNGSRAFAWLPVRDLLGTIVWCAAFTGSSVRWRDGGFRMEAAGRMAPDKSEL